MDDERGTVVKGNSPFSLPSVPPSKPINKGNAQYTIGEFPISEVDTIQTKLVQPCEMCGKIVDHTLHSHHAIPRYMENSGDEDIIQVCLSCHRKADWNYDRFLLESTDEIYGSLNPSPYKYRWGRFILDPHGHGRGIAWKDRAKSVAHTRYYHQEVECKRTLFVMTFCCARCYAYVEVHYNRASGSVGVYDYITASNANPTKRAFKSLFNCTPEYGITLSIDYQSYGNGYGIYTGWKFRHPKTPIELATKHRSRRLGKPNRWATWRKKSEKNNTLQD